MDPRLGLKDPTTNDHESDELPHQLSITELQYNLVKQELNHVYWTGLSSE